MAGSGASSRQQKMPLCQGGMTAGSRMPPGLVSEQACRRYRFVRCVPHERRRGQARKSPERHGQPRGGARLQGFRIVQRRRLVNHVEIFLRHEVQMRLFFPVKRSWITESHTRNACTLGLTISFIGTGTSARRRPTRLPNAQPVDGNHISAV